MIKEKHKKLDESSNWKLSIIFPRVMSISNTDVSLVTP